MSLRYDLSVDTSEARVVLHGRIDRDAAGVLADAYRAAVGAAPGDVVLVFDDVDYINSTGIALIVSVLASARAEGRGVAASGLSEHYQHIFRITRLSDFITIVDPANDRRPS